MPVHLSCTGFHDNLTTATSVLASHSRFGDSFRPILSRSDVHSAETTAATARGANHGDEQWVKLTLKI